MNKKSVTWIVFVSVCALWLLPIQGNLLAQADLGVNRIVIAKNVSDRTPVEPGTEFSSDVGELFCFTAVNNPGDPVAITHVWRHEGQVRSRVDMTIGTSPNWRAWSIKTIMPDWTGSWTVSVLDTAGAEIASTRFEVAAEMEEVPEEPVMPEAEEVEEVEAPEEPPTPEAEPMEEEAAPTPEGEAEPDTTAGQ